MCWEFYSSVWCWFLGSYHAWCWLQAALGADTKVLSIFMFYLFDIDFKQILGVDSRLVLYEQKLWRIGRPSSTILSYCFWVVVYGVHLVWYLLGDAKDWLTSLHVGKEILVIIIMVLFGWQSFIVWCGAFGGKETTGVLKILKGL